MSLTLAFVGDLGLSPRVAEGLRRDLAQPQPPEYVERLRNATLTFANLELPFAEASASHAGVRQLAAPEDAPLLRDLGIDIACLGNNHIFDAGEEGIVGTRRLLDSLGVQSVGAGSNLEEAARPLVVEKDGLRLGFLAFAEGRAYTHKHVARPDRAGAAPLVRELLAQAVEELRPRVDVLVVSMHQGVNYVHYASPRQREFATAAVEAGADLVVGHHPHVLQGVETMGRSLVFYSLGELLFDSGIGNVVEEKWERARRLTAVLEVPIDGRRPSDFRLTPYRRNEDFELESLPAQEARQFESWFLEISEIYEDYDPKIYLEAVDQGVVEHTFKVLLFNLRKGRFGYLMRSLMRIRGRHLRIAWTHLLNRIRRRQGT